MFNTLYKARQTVILAGFIMASQNMYDNPDHTSLFNCEQLSIEITHSKAPFPIKDTPSYDKFLENISALYSEIISYKSLKEDWDGDGAIPSSVNAVDNAIKFFKLALNISRVIPTPATSGEGEVSLCWKNNHRCIDIMFTNNNLARYFIKESIHNKLSGNTEDLNHILSLPIFKNTLNGMNEDEGRMLQS